MAISGCKDRKTGRFLAGQRVREFQGFEDAAAGALTKLQAAVTPGDLRSPPSNRFEALRGDRNGQYSIRIDAQYRVYFKWAPHASENGRPANWRRRRDHRLPLIVTISRRSRTWPSRGRYRVAGQVPGSPFLIRLIMPACSLRSRTGRTFARGPAALLDLRSARRPWGIRSGRRNDQSPIEQRNWETLVAQAGIAMAGSNGLPVFSTPKQITSSLRIAATTICLGLRRPACFRCATSAMTAGL